MKRLGIALFGALIALGAMSTPAVAQGVDRAANPVCAFHGEGCDAPPSEWSWNRLEPRVGVYSVELPCDERQADAFGSLMARTPGRFETGATRACMKDSALFTASLLGFAELPEGARPPGLDALLNGAPDVFTGFVQRVGAGQEIPQVEINGRRAIFNTVEREDGYSRVAIIEVSQFGVLLLTGDIRDGLGVTRAEGEALLDRFFDSLEFAE